MPPKKTPEATDERLTTGTKNEPRVCQRSVGHWAHLGEQKYAIKLPKNAKTLEFRLKPKNRRSFLRLITTCLEDEASECWEHLESSSATEVRNACAAEPAAVEVTSRLAESGRPERASQD